jgi:branched-chain amino acid transport system substrate-binding protein
VSGRHGSRCTSRAIESLQGVVGATGVFNLSARDHNGLTAEDLVVTRIEGGAWRLVP